MPRSVIPDQYPISSTCSKVPVWCKAFWFDSIYYLAQSQRTTVSDSQGGGVLYHLFKLTDDIAKRLYPIYWGSIDHNKISFPILRIDGKFFGEGHGSIACSSWCTRSQLWQINPHRMAKPSGYPGKKNGQSFYLWFTSIILCIRVPIWPLLTYIYIYILEHPYINIRTTCTYIYIYIIMIMIIKLQLQTCRVVGTWQGPVGASFLDSISINVKIPVSGIRIPINIHPIDSWFVAF